jgi:hypothetical protein
VLSWRTVDPAVVRRFLDAQLRPTDLEAARRPGWVPTPVDARDEDRPWLDAVRRLLLVDDTRRWHEHRRVEMAAERARTAVELVAAGWTHARVAALLGVDRTFVMRVADRAGVTSVASR